ncbi:hypothetical protein CRG98_037338 [Punica granatum]|uniref:Integrase catalytic domain-containing protein n=1 Tax=Punica granatum TaxID=22663 RepID=A0A2I0IFX9_PUNGR|nr:hypothetical protein CRG98_037338 [Punica granatum]
MGESSATLNHAINKKNGKPSKLEYQKGVRDIGPHVYPVPLDPGNLPALDLRVVKWQVVTPSHARPLHVSRKVDTSKPRCIGVAHACPDEMKFGCAQLGDSTGDMIRGSPHLLQIWLLTHVRPFCSSHPFSYIADERSLIECLVPVIPPPEHSFSEWRHFWHELTPARFLWIARWNLGGPLITGCPGIVGVPLLSHLGSTLIFPGRVIKQLGGLQDILTEADCLPYRIQWADSTSTVLARFLQIREIHRQRDASTIQRLYFPKHPSDEERALSATSAYVAQFYSQGSTSPQRSQTTPTPRGDGPPERDVGPSAGDRNWRHIDTQLVNVSGWRKRIASISPRKLIHRPRHILNRPRRMLHHLRLPRAYFRRIQAPLPAPDVFRGAPPTSLTNVVHLRRPCSHRSTRGHSQSISCEHDHQHGGVVCPTQKTEPRILKLHTTFGTMTHGRPDILDSAYSTIPLPPAAFLTSDQVLSAPPPVSMLAPAAAYTVPPPMVFPAPSALAPTHPQAADLPSYPPLQPHTNFPYQAPPPIDTLSSNQARRLTRPSSPHRHPLSSRLTPSKSEGSRGWKKRYGSYRQVRLDPTCATATVVYSWACGYPRRSRSRSSEPTKAQRIRGVPGHILNNCWKLRERIQEMIDAKELVFNAVRSSNVQANPLPDHGPARGSSVNMISICALGEGESEQGCPSPFVIEYVPAGTAVGFAGIDASLAPFVINILAREPYSDDKVPWTYEGGLGSLEQQFGVMGITRSRRLYESPAAADKGKAPVIGVEAIPEAPPTPPKKVTEEEAEAFMKIIKASEYKVVEQMAKSPAHISLLAFLLSSEPHREALLRVLTTAQVPKGTSPDRIEETINSIFSNTISFSADELPSEGLHWNPNYRHVNSNPPEECLGELGPIYFGEGPDEDSQVPKMEESLLRLEDRQLTSLEPTKEINVGTKDEPRILKIGTGLDLTQRARMVDFLTRYQEVFAWSYADMPGLDPSIVKHFLPLDTEKFPPKRQQLRRQRTSLLLRIKEEVLKQINAGFLEVCNYSEWVANIVPEIEVYVDDMIAKSREGENHLVNLERLFNRLKKYKLRLNPTKCTFGARSGKLLGFVLSERGIEVDPEKVKAIRELPPPSLVRETNANHSFACSAKTQQSNGTKNVRKPLTPSRVGDRGYLAEFPIEDSTSINPDFPDDGILQVDDEEEKPEWKMYFDGAVNSTGSDICAVTKDAKLVPYHEYLERLAENFEDISFTYTPRMNNQFADALVTLASMVSITKENLIEPLKIEIAKGPAHCNAIEVSEAKPWYEDIKNFLRTGQYPPFTDRRDRKTLRRLAIHYFLSSEILYRRSFDSTLLQCIEEHESRRLMEEVHRGNCAPHMNGLMLAKKIMCLGYYWSTMETNCVKHVRHCHQCQVYADQIKAPPNELRHMTAPWPFSMWGMDAITLASVTVKAVARFLKRDVIARYGVPTMIITDNAKNLNNKVIDELYAQFKIQHRNSTPYRPQMNGINRPTWPVQHSNLSLVDRGSLQMNEWMYK